MGRAAIVSRPAVRDTGVVVIGRNEGERLAACLHSVLIEGAPLVYVDSGSVDASVAQARALGVATLALDPARPFSAARARNEGFALLRRRWPAVRFVQFVDGDCVLAPGWLERAAAHLRGHAGDAVAVGHLHERDAARSVYNLLCALEWRASPGPIDPQAGFGGLFMVRAATFADLGGFDTALVAGEEPELAARLGRAGHRAVRLDRHMATHDAAMTRFSQWWQRAVRSGHAIGQRLALDGPQRAPHGARARRSVLFWTLVPPGAALGLAPWLGAGAALVPLAGYGALAARIRRHRRRGGDTPREAAVYAAFTVLGKFAEAAGLALHAWRRARGRIGLIEHK